MFKTCVNCQKTFKTRDSRQKSCSNKCADVRRAQWRPYNKNTETGRLDSSKPNISNLPKYDLPPPEELPAPYAKRVHDMWAALTDGDAPTRIA